MNKFWWTLLPVDKEAKTEARRDRSPADLVADNDEIHLQETVAWLKRAQDVGIDRGVSRAYKAARFAGFGKFGWQPSYPETTGYLIPSLLALSRMMNQPALCRRALEMARWECGIQLDSGAVMGNVVTAKPTPAVFNTGQVIFGWLAAFDESSDAAFMDSALRAGDYLLSVQGDDGSFQKGDSQFAQKGATVYNARVAWALIELGLATQNEKYSLSGQRYIAYALSRQKRNGWFADNCLNDPAKPLLHTIAYTIQGLLESGLCLNQDNVVESAMRAADAVLGCQRKDGGIPGRLDQNWSSTQSWDCVTGDAQMAIVWLRAHHLTGQVKYRDAARRLIEFIKKTQNLHHPNPGMRGGVKGSFPFDGSYGAFEMLNWAAKFFCDALMMAASQDIAGKGIKG